MNCECGHERHYHFVIDEDGHEDEMRCAFFDGSGRFRCTCAGYDEEVEHASA